MEKTQTEAVCGFGLFFFYDLVVDSFKPNHLLLLNWKEG